LEKSSTFEGADTDASSALSAASSACIVRRRTQRVDGSRRVCLVALSRE